MSPKYNEQELTEFLDYLSGKGLLNSNTAQGRKVATLKILAALDDHEKVDLRNIDRDATFHRFVNRFGKGFSPGSLKVYRARFNSALDEFIRYQDNPSGYKSATAARNASTRSERSDGTVVRITRTRPTREGATASAHTGAANAAIGTVVFPIPLREGLVVQIHNLPPDLTRAEAAKISAVVTALSISKEDS